MHASKIRNLIRFACEKSTMVGVFSHLCPFNNGVCRRQNKAKLAQTTIKIGNVTNLGTLLPMVLVFPPYLGSGKRKCAFYRSGDQPDSTGRNNFEIFTKMSFEAPTMSPQAQKDLTN